MTPAQLSHLRAIDAHLERLLGIAAKRTPGEWSIYDAGGVYQCPGIEAGCNSIVVVGDKDDDAGVRTGADDAAFIASCAGNAEAGWKATRAAIADWLSLYNSTEGYADGATDASPHDKLCNEVASICRINLQHILAAFPLESLNS